MPTICMAGKFSHIWPFINVIWLGFLMFYYWPDWNPKPLLILNNSQFNLTIITSNYDFYIHFLSTNSFCTCTSLFQALPLYKLSITDKVVQAVQSMLLPQEGSLSIHTCLPASGDGSSPFMAAVRLLAEIRTRSEITIQLKLFLCN